MAEVYLAKQKSLDRLVAIKLLREGLAEDETYVRRFIREAQAAAKLEHPNIVRIYEVGTFGILHYICQEYIAGMNLQMYLRRHGPLSIEQTFSVMMKMASALQKASDFGIVHRDIKPDNILLGETGVLKIADFGLARTDSLSNKADTSLTQCGVTLGTPLYMSPEQSDGKSIDFRSDIYSLGVTAFQILTGKTPFSAETPLAVILQHLNEPAPDVRHVRKDVPPELAQIIARMLEKKPEDRYSSLKELIDELRRAKSIAQSMKSDSALAITDDFFSLDSIEETGEQSALCSGFENDESFCATMAINALSLQIQDHAITYRKQRERNHFWAFHSLRGAFALVGALLLAFCFGLGIAFYYQVNSYVQLKPPLVAVIERFDSVEEQWVFASQLGTIEAWKSVDDYFPNKIFWKRKARQQLARTYILENEVNEAKLIFLEFLAMPTTESGYIAFGRAGVAWCLAAEGNIPRATALLSELRAEKKESFDHLTEDIISRTQELIRNRKN